MGYIKYVKEVDKDTDYGFKFGSNDDEEKKSKNNQRKTFSSILNTLN